MIQILPKLILCLLVSGICLAQTAEILPVELSRIPVGAIGDASYWQQLVITLAHDEAPGDSTISVELPLASGLRDTDGDGEVGDEVRVMYAAVGDETPEFFTSSSTSFGAIVVGSIRAAASGGKVYIQFPIEIVSELGLEALAGYGEIKFKDPRSVDIPGSESPLLTFVTAQQFDALESMDLVPLGFSLVGILDTVTTAQGTWYPAEPEPLALHLPDLVFDGGVGNSSNMLPVKDGDDGNDVLYRFFLSTNPSLVTVDAETALEVLVGEDSVYRENEREGEGLALRLLTRDLPSATYFLYVTADVTGRIPLARSRGIFVRHDPQINELKLLEGDITLDSGAFFDARGEITGEGRHSTQIAFDIFDHDNTPTVHLFYSEEALLTLADVQVSSEVVSGLVGATQIIDAAGLQATADTLTWDILEPDTVPPGNYYIYAVANDGMAQVLSRSESRVRVQHSPLLRLDALDDGKRSGNNTVATGGLRPQRFVTLTWGRSGFGGDEDVDDNARISLYFSEKPAADEPGCDCFTVLSGADELLEQVGESAFLIAADLPEDPDRREDNQYVWDLWAIAQEGRHVPREDEVNYIYGIIEDDHARRLVQMHSRRFNDVGSRVVFVHAPTILPLQPVADITASPGSRARVAWEDMDLDDDARIRIVLSTEDQGPISDYAALVAAVAHVANSADGSAVAAVHAQFDLSEDSEVDHFDVRIDQIATTADGSGAFQDGDYFVYLAITEGESFDATSRAWRVPGKILARNMEEEGGNGSQNIRLLPEVLSIGTGGTRQQFDLVADDGGEEVDQISLRLELSGKAFSAVDQDETADGIQPFRVGEAFSATQIFVNELVVEDDQLKIAFDYFDPTASQIPNLDGQHILASMELITLEEEGLSQIKLEVDAESVRVSRLLRNSLAVFTPEAGPIVDINIVDGKAEVSGEVALEGRTDKSVLVDVALRQWGNYAAFEDSAFAAENDRDEEREGVQVELESDGDFELEQVPTGRFDLYFHLDGYLDAWVPGLELYADQEIEDLRPTSTGDAADNLMLGGDVAGYTDTNGQTQPDNEVSLADWDYVAALFNRNLAAEEDSARADINGDGVVNIGDLALVGANFRASGPRPVYKAPAADPGEALLHLSLGADAVRAGREVELELGATGLEGVRAYEVELTYDVRDWRLIEIRPNGERVLAVQHIAPTGVRLAATLIGRERDFSGVGVLAQGTLQALRDDPAPPTLRPIALLDRRHRPVAARALERREVLPQAFALQQNYPNPFNPETAIAFAVPVPEKAASGAVQLEIFNVLGQRVAVLWDAPLAPGQYRMTWNGLDRHGLQVGSGIYLYRLRTGRGELVKRMILLR